MWVVLNSRSTSWNLIERVIFPAPTPSYTVNSFPGELILIPREDGAKVPCLFLPFQHARFLFIYFHANAEDLGLSHTFCTILRDLFQVHVLAVEYPGYGICPGTCDEAGVMANASAAMEFAIHHLKWPRDGIKLFGRSLGTGPTMALAARHDIAGVILISPFTSIKDLFHGQVGFLADMVENRFCNIDLAPRISSPTLIIHGMQDALVPPEHGRKVYGAITSRRMLVTPNNMSHNTSLLKDVATFILPMTHFFSLPDYTFEELEVPDWVFPVTTPKEEEAQDNQEDLVEMLRQANQKPGWLASASWLCGRSACNQPGRGLEESIVEPISRLKPEPFADPPAQRKGDPGTVVVDMTPSPTRTASAPAQLQKDLSAAAVEEGVPDELATLQPSQVWDPHSPSGLARGANPRTGSQESCALTEVSREYKFGRAKTEL
ncbi:aho-3 [Symbiodinium sp. CCMP2456]|nr:aho-3 [Symbiodinium sp. CCMP2456]